MMGLVLGPNHITQLLHCIAWHSVDYRFRRRLGEVEIMGRKAMDWAWRQTGLSANEMLVLICLADHHNDKTGQCNPKRERIASMVGISLRAVTDLTNKLQESGKLKKEERRHGARQAATQYHLAVISERFQGQVPYTLKAGLQGEDMGGVRVKPGCTLIEQKKEQEHFDFDVVDDGDVADAQHPRFEVILGGGSRG